MRVTTQMLDKSARRAGLPINRSSLLDHMSGNGNNKSLLDALDKKSSTAIDTENKKKYEKLDKTAEKLINTSDIFLKDGEKGLFDQAKESGDKQKIYDSIKTFFADYNSGIKALRDTPGTMNDFYRQMLVEASEDAKEELTKAGISFAKDGTASVDMDKLKSVDIENLEKLFGHKSEIVSKVKFIATRVSNNAEAGIKSYSSGYSSKGNPYNSGVNSRFDFKG